MDREERRKRFKGVVGVTVTPFDSDYEVDYGKMYNLTEWWVENGMVRDKAMLKVASVMGEFQQLRDDEWPPLIRSVVQASKGKVDIIAGSQFKDTKRTIEDCKKATDLGAFGIQIAAPALNDPNQDDILRFYADVSNAVDIGIMIYNTPWQRKGGITSETLYKLADYENIVAIKWAPWEDCPDTEMEGLGAHFNLIENGPIDRVGFHKAGGHGFLDISSVAYPKHELRMWDLLESRLYEEAQHLWETVDDLLMNFDIETRKVSGGQARFKKMIMNAMGHEVGEQRPPTLPATDKEMSDLKKLLQGFNWPVPK